MEWMVIISYLYISYVIKFSFAWNHIISSLILCEINKILRTILINFIVNPYNVTLTQTLLQKWLFTMFFSGLKENNTVNV